MSDANNVLPLEVVYDYTYEKWEVVTRMGHPCGPRLLKGVNPPVVNRWLSTDEQDANELCEKLTQHIENDWPKKKKKGKRNG
tara:strand:- start:499 stop:744 length:246 start_codon:yes stop_codon:yes gene_type:complete